MAGLILKSPYYKPNSRDRKSGSRGGMVKYIGTREGVEMLRSDSRSGMAGYVNARKGSNGLFTDEGEAINMAAVMKEVDEHPGNVWCHIFSLTREDAERLGYNRAEEWMNLLRSHRNDIAREMGIDPANLRWYAAYHQHPTHPHVHMMVWSRNPTEAYLSKKGIANIKRFMAQDIFRQDMISVYREQTVVRDELKESFRSQMETVLNSVTKGEYTTDLTMLLADLSDRLKKTKGKKVYGYLEPKTKKVVDAIVKLIASEPEIEKLYDLWHKYQCDTYRLYTDAMPEKVPLEENKEFKSVRNMVVKMASGFTLPPPIMMDKNVDRLYRQGRRQISSGDTDAGIRQLAEAAEYDPWCRIQLAMAYDNLGDRESCLRELRRAAEEYEPARTLLDRVERNQNPYLFNCAVNLLYYAGRMLTEDTENVAPVVRQGVDSKLAREIWAKDHGVRMTM